MLLMVWGIFLLNRSEPTGLIVQFAVGSTIIIVLMIGVIYVIDKYRRQ
jgi:hypothetical protein